MIANKMEQKNERRRLSLSSIFFLSRPKSDPVANNSSKTKSKNGRRSFRFWSRKAQQEPQSGLESDVESELEAGADTEFKIRSADKKSKSKDSQKHKQQKRQRQQLEKEKDQQQEYLKSKEAIMSDIMDRKNDSTFCTICLETIEEEGAVYRLVNCNHYVCKNCLETYLRIEVSESRIMINCPMCSEAVHPNEIRTILNDEKLVAKYEDFMLRKVLAIDPDARWCPAPDCGFAVIASGCASCPKLKCERPGCNSYFCYHCKSEWHPNQTCDTARNQRLSNSRTSLINLDDIPVLKGSDVKQCPVCQVVIVKMDDGSCNHMVCALCGSEFCWLCMRVVGDLHYLSPSGCTFWGKKPWSKKKKLLWQLGTLLGAPIGILLVAGIAIPALLVGIPIWVAPRLYRRYRSANKHKRNFAVFTGTLASILMSPIVAGLTISVGIPILLFYVYGIVPISLCRNRYSDKKKNPKNKPGTQQGRMATAEATDAETGEPTASATATATAAGLASSVDEIEPKTIFDDINLDMLGNMSIGGESMTSGSQILTADYEKDKASISNKALAGSIVSNTLLNLSPIPHIDDQNDFFKINVTVEENVDNQDMLKESLSAVLGLPIQIENSNESKSYLPASSSSSS